MNRRLHHVLPPELGIEPVALFDFPLGESEIGDVRLEELRQWVPILNLTADEISQALCVAFNRVDTPLAQMFARAIAASHLTVWKGEAWINCHFRDRDSADRIAGLLLKFPLQDSPHINPAWPAQDQQLLQILSGLREDYPPSGGAFWDGQSPATFYCLDESEQFPKDARPGQLIFTARNGDLIVREEDGRYVWWRSACSERVSLARDAAEFEAHLLNHFARDWVTRKNGPVLWPLDGFGPGS